MAARRRFTDEQEREIASQYPAKSTTQLAKINSVSSTTIRDLLKRQGVKLRSNAEAHRKFTDEQEAEIVAQYPEKSTHQLAKLNNVGVTTIISIFERQGVKLRSSSEATRRFTDEQEAEIAAQYPEKDARQLAKLYKTTDDTIVRAIKRQGKAVRGSAIPERADYLSAELLQLIEALGDNIHNLPQKSWLAILRQSNALKSVGPHSVFAPVKVALLRGELTPADIIKPEVDDDTQQDQPATQSKLEIELNKLVEAYGDDEIEEVEDDIEDVTEAPQNIIDEDEEQTQRLANLRPAQRLSIATSAAKATSDAKVLRGICHTQCEQLWGQVFRADSNNPQDAHQLVAEVQQAQPADKWATLVRNTFLEDWRLVQECGQIPSLLMPDGWRLNLMQRREAALLLRDRARLNISGMGSGKTLASIAGAQVRGAKRVLVLCPNATVEGSWLPALNQHLPSAGTASRTWQPNTIDMPEPQWVINHHEMLSDLKASELAAFLCSFEPEMVIIDEIHLCKSRNPATESQRYRNLQSVADWCRNNNAAIYGMSGTPVVNELSEPLSLLRLVRPDLTKGLDSKLSGDNAMDIHEALQPISSRFVPESPAKLIKRTVEVRADHLFEDALEASKSNGVAVDAALAPAKFEAVKDLAQQGGKLLVFTSSVTGVVDDLKAYLASADITAVVHTGSEKGINGNGNVRSFIENPTVKVLIASTSTLATGFDGLQRVCNRIAFLTLPWTAAEHEQAIARVLRQGLTSSTVEVTTICAALIDPTNGEDWSLDQQKISRLDSKRSLGSAVCDGVIPDQEALVGGLTAVAKAHRKWAKSVSEKLNEASA